jgi:hypothetical protein
VPKERKSEVGQKNKKNSEKHLQRRENLFIFVG